MSTRLLGTDLRLANKETLLKLVHTATATNPVRIATVNPEFMLEALGNSQFKHAIESMTAASIDGSGLAIALSVAKLTRRAKPSTTTLYHGADFIHDLFEKYSDGSKSFFLLGPSDKALTNAESTLKQNFPKLHIVGTNWGGKIANKDVVIDTELAKEITSLQPDILLVGFGAPRQELWIQAATKLPIPTMIGIGGTVEFYGLKKRAPKVYRALYLEWLFRTFHEKGHAKRAFRAAVVFPLRFTAWLLTNR